MSCQHVEIMMVIDRSGSMETMGKEVFGGFNTFVQGQVATQKKTNAKMYLTTIRFDHKVEVVHDHLFIKKVPMATFETFEPRGMTALFDAVGQGVAMLTKRIDAMESKPKVIFVILTDGEENASNKITEFMFQNMIQECKGKKWEFVFLAANQDAVQVGQSFGIQKEACMTFESSEQSCHATMNSLTSQVQRSVSVPNSRIEFSKLERARSVPSQSNTPLPRILPMTRHISYRYQTKTPGPTYAMLTGYVQGQTHDELVTMTFRFQTKPHFDLDHASNFKNARKKFQEQLKDGKHLNRILGTRLLKEEEIDKTSLIVNV